MLETGYRHPGVMLAIQKSVITGIHERSCGGTNAEQIGTRHKARWAATVWPNTRGGEA